MQTERIRKILANIIEQRDYSKRIEKLENEQCDPLVELINQVLAETEKRGKKLENQKKSLKDQVLVRTADLEKSNQQWALDKP